MGLEDFGKKAQLSDKTTKALGMVDATLSAISTCSSVYSLGISVLGWMGFFDSPSDPYLELLNAIEQDLKEIYDAVFEASILESRRDIADIVAWSKITARQAAKYIKAGREPANPAFIFASPLDNESLHATTALADSSYWHRLFNVNADHPWLKKPNNNYVWDYRLTLPCYLQAIASRLVVIEAIDPDYRTTHSYAGEISSYAAFLSEVYNEIKSKIIKYGPYESYPPVPSNPNQLIQTEVRWYRWNVVSLHTGLAYTSDEIYILWDELSWELYVNKIEKDVETAYSKLCNDVGLSKLQGIINHLNHLANSPPLDSLHDLVEEIGTMRLIFATQGKTDIVPFPLLDGQISMRHLASIVGVPLPISLRKMLRQQFSPDLL